MDLDILFGQGHGLVQNEGPRLDTRTDADIIASLHRHVPVASERNVWAFWNNGFAAMSPWMQRNLVNWVRRQGQQDWTVRLLDTVPESPNHVYAFLPPQEFPAAAREGRMTSRGMSVTISDFSRIALLYHHGGVYMDVGIMLIRDLDDICWSSLQDEATPYRVAGMTQDMGRSPYQMHNSFLAARRQDPFLHRWQQVGLCMWEGRVDNAGTHDDPLLRHLGLLKFSSPAIPESADWASFNDYLNQYLAFERVRLNREPGPGGFDGPSYFQKHFFLLDARTEMFYGQDFDGGEAVVRWLSLPREITREPEESGHDQDRAREFVHNILARSSMCKFSQGTARLGLTFLVATHWSKPEHADADCRPGTWGELLRHGSINFRQTRMPGTCLTPLEVVVETETITNLGILEPAL
ncbi:glycosyltransferase [Lasiosphaeris hirsuta]|uniref:Glycosyltransferase n=1 Tax=Lasiosphaeris hirsuta TaxID=260670 RepID=A0AA40E5R5_9PEZI|nr:glycosyltransferase [Lasiosphaeris hirsuta]